MSRDEFIERRAAVLPTLESVGVPLSAVLLIGGTGLAMHGINTHWGVRSSEWTEHGYKDLPFDLDVLLEQRAFYDLKKRAAELRGAEIGFNKVTIAPQQRGLLPFDGVILDDSISKAMQQEGIEPVEIDGLQTLPADTLASLKNARNRPRDTVGILLGHHEAYHLDLAVVDTPSWRAEVDVSLGRARSLRDEPTRTLGKIASEFALPQLFLDFVRNDFDDSAFRGN